MKYTYILFLALCTVISTQSSAQSTDEDVLRQLKEVEWPRAYQKQDTALLDKILATEFQMIDASGNVFKKKDELMYIRDFKPSYDKFEFNVGRLDVFENDMAIVSGLGVITGSDDEGDYQTTYHSSDVLIKREGNWQAVASHVSGLQKQYLAKQ